MKKLIISIFVFHVFCLPFHTFGMFRKMGPFRSLLHKPSSLTTSRICAGTSLRGPAVRQYSSFGNQSSFQRFSNMRWKSWAFKSPCVLGLSAFLYNFYPKSKKDHDPDKSKPSHVFPYEEYENLIIALKADQQVKRQKVFSSVPDEWITKLYSLRYSTMNLYKAQKEINEEKRNIKKIFENSHFTNCYHIWGREGWTEKEWLQFEKALDKNANEKPPWSVSIHLDETGELLKHAKAILKSFVPSDGNLDLHNNFVFEEKESSMNMGFILKLEGSEPNLLNSRFVDEEISHKKEKFIKKGPGTHRFFVYTKLEKVIQEKQLSHVRLPLKILVIKDLETEEYYIGAKATEIIDDMTKIFIKSNAWAEIVLASDKYEFLLLANREDCRGGLSPMTCKDLASLVSEAPFDVGYDNIFGSDNGDCVIIDTEFKGTPANIALPKLARYGCCSANCSKN